MTMNTKPAPTRREILILAAESDLDTRTVESFLRGERVQRTTRRVILDAAARIGLAHLIPQEPATAA